MAFQRSLFPRFGLLLSLSAFDSDAQYSRSDPGDLDMVKIEAKLPLYDHDSRSSSSCSEDDLEALTFVFGHERY